jgi:hypothetical protein
MGGVSGPWRCVRTAAGIVNLICELDRNAFRILMPVCD